MSDMSITVIDHAMSLTVLYIMATSFLMVEKAGVPGENHRPWASNW